MCGNRCGKEYAVPVATSAFTKRLEADYNNKQARKRELVRKQQLEEQVRKNTSYFIFA